MKKGRSKDYLKGTRRGRSSNHFQLEKFLTGKIGQNWNKIHSELCEEFDKRTYAGREFFKDLEWRVETKCWKGAETGTIYGPASGEISGFYVHPLSGCLEYLERPRYVRPEEPLTRISIGINKRYEKEKGIWYYVRVDPNQYYSWASIGDAPAIAEKRQLGKKELRALGLQNDPPEEPKCLTQTTTQPS